MTSKILLRLLPLGILLLIGIIHHYSSNSSGYTDNAERNAVEPQTIRLIRRRRTIKPATIHYCKFNQYYDQEEGRCLGVPGGGKVLHVESGRSCGINVLKPHCKSSLYYHICKRDKSILAQCASGQIFDNRLQRCAYYDSSKLTPSIIPPDSYMYYDHVGVPSCTRSGRFPVLDHCSMFYTCDTNGHRFYQSIFKCPQNTGYQVDRGICNVVPDCLNDNSVNTVCVPAAPGENVESPSLNEGNVKETPEIFQESKASTDDPIVESEKNVNSKIYDDIVTTPKSIIGTLSENNYSNSNNNMNVSSNNENLPKSVEVPDAIDKEIMHSQVPNLPETIQKAPDKGQDEENGSSSLLGLQITSPSSIELDDAPYSITTSMTSIKPEYRTNADVHNETDTAPFSSSSYILSKLNEGTHFVTTEQYQNIKGSALTPSSFNTDSVDLQSIPTANNVPESSPISDILPNIDEKMQDTVTKQYKSNEDSTLIPPNSNIHSIDLNSAPIVSNIPESSPISDISPNIEKMEDVTTEQYKNNEESVLMPSNLNIDSIDPNSAPTISNVPESSPISDVSPNIDEKIQDTVTKQYKNNEDSISTLSNINTDSTDLHSIPTISNVSESSPINNVSPNIDDKMQDIVTEQYKNNEESTLMPSNSNIHSVDPNSAPTISNVPESSSISDVPPNIDEKIQDTVTEQYKNNEDSISTLSNINTDSTDLHSIPTISNVSESSPINNVSPNIDEKIQDTVTEQYKNNEDSTSIPPNSNIHSIDLNSAPIVSNIPESFPISDVSPDIDEKIQDPTTEQYKNNEESVLMPSNLNIDSVDPNSAPTISNVPEFSSISDVPPNIDEKIQDTVTEQYKNNEDSISTLSNINTDSTDLHSIPTISNVSESSPINNVSPNIDEKMQDTVTEQYKNNEDSTLVPPNSNIHSIDLNSAPIVSNVPESSPISDVSPNIDEKMQDATTEQYKNNEESVLMPSNLNIDSVDPNSAPTISNVPESSPISDVSPNIDEKIQDTVTEQYKNNEDSISTLSNINTDSTDLHSIPTISNVSESSPINNVSPNIDEKMQDATTEQYKNNEESVLMPSNLNIDSVDPNSAPIVSNIPESSPISDVSPNIDEKMQDAATEQYKNNEDSALTPSNFNTDSTDLHSTPTTSNVPESSLISDVSPNIDEKMQDSAMKYKNNEDKISNFNPDSVQNPIWSNISEFSPNNDMSTKLDEEVQSVTTEMYRKDDKAVTLPNSSTEVVDPNLTSALKDIPATIDSPKNGDVLSSTLTPTILPSQATVDQLTTEGSLETMPSADSKLADASLSTLDGVESAST